MRRRALCGLPGILAGIVAIALTRTACAQGDQWASRPGSVMVPAADPLQVFPRRELVQRSALQNYWETKRQTLQVSAQERSPARFGYYGGYYSMRTTTQSVPFGPTTYTTDFGASHRAYDDLYYEYKYDLLDPIDYQNLCDSHSSIEECLGELHRTGRR